MGEVFEPGHLSGPAEYGTNGGLRYAQRIDGLIQMYTGNIEHNVKWSLTNHLALLRASRGDLSWDTVEATANALLFAENMWGKQGNAQIDALGRLDHFVYTTTKNLCVPLREKMDVFLHLPEAKSTLGNHLKREATKRNLRDERGVVYTLNLNINSPEMTIVKEIAGHYSVRKSGNLFLMHSPKWLKDVTDNMYPASATGKDIHYMPDPQILETLQILWEGTSVSLTALCRTAELL